MQNDIFNIDISLEELFQFIFWKTHCKKYSSLCRHLEELQISFLLITPDKNGEIQKIVYEKENEFTVRNKYLICCVSCQEKKAGKIIRQFTNSYILG